MGAGCSFFRPDAGSNSYDFPGRESLCHEVQSAGDHAFDEKQVAGPEPGNRSLSAGTREIVSQSQCEVNVTDSSSHLRDVDIENSKTVYDAKAMNQTSTLGGAPLHPAASKDERLLVDDFKPGHVSHMDNSAEKQTTGHANTSGDDELLNVLAQASDEEIQKVVDKCWQDIENTCRNQRDTTSSPSPELKTKGWRVVRLFVSSTFADYHAEREVLVKKVCLNFYGCCA